MSDIKIYIQRQAYRKLRYFTVLCEEEISGFGKVERINGFFVITDFQIFKQTVSGAHSDMDDDALASFLFEKTKAGEDLSKWRVWWHSHAKMNAFFSGTDTGTIDKSTEFPWLISLVTNHEGDLIGRIDVFDPIRADEKIKVEIIEDEDPELKALCEKEIKEKVKTYESTYDWKNFKTKKHDKNKKFYPEDDDYYPGYYHKQELGDGK